ncbi:hypothetical protein JG687_00018455 [Phytophthora cactorum]|uniref:Uncharacterized protein n=1 Tax=Phytophthora cactorum TaxID=29920 RepID=A0A8T1TLM4_9STRA|nr:hypothetical protein PC113_g16434 [Phytophthora cactorum]KAG2982104.1 hypothetical protein PC120_g24706 [Phytophthora cactorum]KAG3051962.1 hypothetical protein PC121_g17542 [Phytophthora cactorum]KAG3077230.1 hypothetical protein PC122_g13260 [Phytophthora cactorum]KAG3145075.1 hypothetical protein C6341_g18533 [Phytophthora cactorum]
MIASLYEMKALNSFTWTLQQMTIVQQPVLSVIIFQAAAISRTVGHSKTIVPKPEGNAEYPYYIGGPSGTIDKLEIIGASSYGDHYQAVDDWFTNNNVANLEELITTYGKSISECGNTEKKGTAQPVPCDGYVQHDTL